MTSYYEWTHDQLDPPDDEDLYDPRSDVYLRADFNATVPSRTPAS